MAVSSLYFLGFLAVLFALYYIAPLKFRWITLFLASVAFYLFAGWKFFIVLIFTSGCVYLGGLLIDSVIKKRGGYLAANKSQMDKETRKMYSKKTTGKKKWALIFPLLLALSCLCYFKYLGFADELSGGIFTQILPAKIMSVSLWEVLGISFFTFQSLGYLIDVYREVAPAQRNPFKLFLFTGFFGSVSMGPICRYNDLAPQLYEGHKFDYERTVRGLIRIAWGFFKKLVIADAIAPFVNEVYGGYEKYPGGTAIMATVLFAFQLYCDFSGYMDIVIGAAKTLGITLPENFDTPYFSLTISEYWRRWHITLGLWFKDYLFYPMLKSAFIQWINKRFAAYWGKKFIIKFTTYVCMYVLWFVIGLWHSAGWNFIIGSGLLHGTYIIFGEVCEPLWALIKKTFRINTDCFSYKLFQGLRTFSLVCVGFVFFRTGLGGGGLLRGIRILLHMGHGIFSWTFITPTLRDAGFDLAFFVPVAAFLLALFTCSLLSQKRNIGHAFRQQNLLFRWIFYAVLCFLILFFGKWNLGAAASNQFLYFVF